LDVEVVAPASVPAAEPDPEPEPEEEPEEILVGAAGIRQMNRKSLPRWLAAMFVVVPLAALFYAATFASGAECGAGGALAIDPATGVAENCDGSEFGSAGTPLKLGAALYAAEAAPTCASCHGTDGSGGTGPALAGGSVVETFPACEDHIKWVSLGTDRWRDEVGNTYGASNAPVGGGGVMQSYEDAGLTAEEIAAVVLYERVRFGNEDADAAEAACFPEDEAGE
jgi:mono/diheme cytochrome c family protein